MSTLIHSFTFSVTGSGGETATLALNLSSEQVGVGLNLQTQVIGTSAETLSLGDLANVSGGLMLKNNDATNYVEIDSASSFDKFPQKVLPGRAIMLAPQTVTIHARANTAAVSVSLLAAVL